MATSWVTRGNLKGPPGDPANITAHEGASNPHPQYLTDAEGDARYPLTTDARLSVKPWPPVDMSTTGSAVTINAALGTHFRVAATGGTTISFAAPTTPTDGQVIVVEFTASGGARTASLVTTGGGWLFGTDVTGPLTSTPVGTTDFWQAVYRTSTTKWRVLAYVKGY